MRLFPFSPRNPNLIRPGKTHTYTYIPERIHILNTKSLEFTHVRTHTHTHTFAQWLAFMSACTQIHISWGVRHKCLVRQVWLLWRPKTGTEMSRDPIVLACQGLSSGWFPSLLKKKKWTWSCIVCWRQQVSETLESMRLHLYTKTLNGTSHSVKLKSVTVWNIYEPAALKLGYIHCHKACIPKFLANVLQVAMQDSLHQVMETHDKNIKFLFFMNNLENLAAPCVLTLEKKRSKK